MQTLGYVGVWWVEREVILRIIGLRGKSRSRVTRLHGKRRILVGNSVGDRITTILYRLRLGTLRNLSSVVRVVFGLIVDGLDFN